MSETESDVELAYFALYSISGSKPAKQCRVQMGTKTAELLA